VAFIDDKVLPNGSSRHQISQSEVFAKKVNYRAQDFKT